MSRYYFVTILSMFIHSWASHRFIKAVNFYLLIWGDVRRKALFLSLSISLLLQKYSLGKIFWPIRAFVGGLRVVGRGWHYL